MSFKQANWKEPLIFEHSKPGKIGYYIEKPSEKERKLVGNIEDLVPENLRRNIPPELPEVSEVEVIRHFMRLSQQCYGVDFGIYPLGSCTMKYTPKAITSIVKNYNLIHLHPYEDQKFTQGILRILFELTQFFKVITGFDEVTLQPAAGAQGELVGILMIRAYHKLRGELGKRDEILIPDSAHGTNPASAKMAGFKVVEIPSNDRGMIDLDALNASVSNRTAGMMITNPNTLGLFEKNILEISDTVHKSGGLLYYDGANLNAIMGKTRPGDMGFDIAHINVHKTFSTPHGGGGPGSGPVCVKKGLKRFLPNPLISFDGRRYFLDYDLPDSIGKVRCFYFNTPVLVEAYAYILLMGVSGLEKVAEIAVLNSNYVTKKLQKIKGFSLPFSPSTPRKHESVISAELLKKDTGVSALDISKSLLDYGMHAPTNYFPLLVHEALMIEPTETECKEELDRFIDSFRLVGEDAYQKPDKLKSSPRNTTVHRVDYVKASHPKTMCLNWKTYKERLSKNHT